MQPALCREVAMLLLLALCSSFNFPQGRGGEAGSKTGRLGKAGRRGGQARRAGEAGRKAGKQNKAVLGISSVAELVLSLFKFETMKLHEAEILAAVAINMASNIFRHVHVLYEMQPGLGSGSSCSWLASTLANLTKAHNHDTAIADLVCTEVDQQPTYRSLLVYCASLPSGSLVYLSNPDMVFEAGSMVSSLKLNQLLVVSARRGSAYLLRRILRSAYDLMNFNGPRLSFAKLKEEVNSCLSRQVDRCFESDYRCRRSVADPPLSWDAYIFRVAPQLANASLLHHSPMFGYQMNVLGAENMFTQALRAIYPDVYNVCAWVHISDVHCAPKMHSQKNAQTSLHVQFGIPLPVPHKCNSLQDCPELSTWLTMRSTSDISVPVAFRYCSDAPMREAVKDYLWRSQAVSCKLGYTGFALYTRITCRSMHDLNDEHPPALTGSESLMTPARWLVDNRPLYLQIGQLRGNTDALMKWARRQRVQLMTDCPRGFDWEYVPKRGDQLCRSRTGCNISPCPKQATCAPGWLPTAPYFQKSPGCTARATTNCTLVLTAGSPRTSSTTQWIWTLALLASAFGARTKDVGYWYEVPRSPPHRCVHA